MSAAATDAPPAAMQRSHRVSSCPVGIAPMMARVQLSLRNDAATALQCVVDYVYGKLVQVLLLQQHGLFTHKLVGHINSTSIH